MFTLHSGSSVMTRTAKCSVTLESAAAPLQLVEAAVPGGEAHHVYLHVAGDVRAPLLPSHGMNYGQKKKLPHNAYLAGQPVLTETNKSKVDLAKKQRNYMWIKKVEDGCVSYQHYYAAVGGEGGVMEKRHPAVRLWLGRDGNNVVLQAEPFYWRQEAVAAVDPVAAGGGGQ
jgi:hypothetical protein